MTFNEMASEFNIQPYELAAFLDLGVDIPEGELPEDLVTDIREVMAYDSRYNAKPEN